MVHLIVKEFQKILQQRFGAVGMEHFIMFKVKVENVEICEERKVSASVGVVIVVIYAVMVLLVYYAQITSVQSGGLNEQAVRILDFQRGGLLFNYDLLGYGMMALSTLFIGFSINPSSKVEKLETEVLLHYYVGVYIFFLLVY